MKNDQVMTNRILITAVLTFLAIASSGMVQGRTGAMDTAKQLLEAFNRHDPAAMAALVDEKFELYHVSGGESELSASGPEDLRKQMVEYFGSHPTVRSDIEGSIAGQRFVAFRERASSLHEGVRRGRSSLAVYEVVNGKVLRAWYYPAEGQREETPGSR